MSKNSYKNLFTEGAPMVIAQKPQVPALLFELINST